ncbi:metal-dependent protease of the PAD1/JAB1 superfamily [Clostridium botulinum]|uniref:LysM peptidoglycan-binding domain-containing protein n=1 Tax=unclassified Clostridium TaxID=2614128 RepID=UPI001DF81B19|nr:MULTISPECIES: LysM peptidoglycan-binding domain-containing protein [unclassified Clostridium]MBN1055186.1 metal-dependent protease of the PAD1/JAB1 superfamily [Clostridium botulinum]
MKEIEILEDEKINKCNKIINLPVNFVVVGEIDVNDIKIYIKQNVYKEIEKFSKEDTSHERGGILIGDYAEINNKKNVIISGFIEARYTDASASTLTFTHETWNYIHKEHEKLYPEKKILGWQHTHPNYGIFLSDYDIFIQKNFFNLSCQIAYVVDPIAGTRGFFQWKNDKVEKANGFYIFDDVENKIDIKKMKSCEKKEKVKLFSIIMIFLTIILLSMTVYFGIKKFNVTKELSEMISTNTKIIAEKDKLAKELQQSNELIQKLQQGDNSSKTMKESEEAFNEIIKLKVYTVQQDDTLNEICEKSNVDYVKNKSTILKINDIENEDKIYFRQKLYLPLD